jgi:hypothetical protein
LQLIFLVVQNQNMKRGVTVFGSPSLFFKTNDLI